MKKLFIISQSIICLTFIVCDLLRIDSTYIKYLGIVLCFVYSIYTNKTSRIFSIFFTLLADLFLFVINNYYEIGVLCFIIVHTIYAYHLKKLDQNSFKSILFLRVVLLLLGLIILYITNNLNLLNVLVIICFINLLLNTAHAFLSKNRVLFFGLLLFVCCDVCVGIHNLNAANDIATLIWFFYLPSQVLIVLS